MLDSLGSQRYTEQQMLYMRKVKALEHELDSLEQKRRALESSIGVSQLEVGSGKLQASDSEAARMTDFAAATHESQTRLAQESAERAVNQALIENDRDRVLLEAELEANRRLVELDQKYSASIQGAQSESDKSRLRSELEVEKAKAEAQRKKAQAEADAIRDLSRLEQDYQSRISSAKQREIASTQAVSQETQAQRIKVALANADAKRRVKDDLTGAQTALLQLKTEKQDAMQSVLDEIANLNAQLNAAKGRLAGVEASFNSQIAMKQSHLDTLNAQSQQLAEVEQTLINSPVIGLPGAMTSTPEVQRLEAELQDAKANLLAQKANRLAEIELQLGQDLEAISGRLNAQLNSQPTGASEVTARIDKAVSENAIRAELAAKKTQINNEARSKLAELAVKTEIAKASVVPPVLTNRAVYSGTYGARPEAFAVKQSTAAVELVAKAKSVQKPVSVDTPTPEIAVKDKVPGAGVAPLIVASSFEPRKPGPVLSNVEDGVVASGVMFGGDLKPLVIAPAATTYSVVYRYTEKGSADKFIAYLRAYGITDFTYRYSEKLGQHVLFMGKYTDKDQAVSRVAFLNKTTNTANAQIVENDL
ncbi:hypothetical protein [Pseudomonas aeruginosa]|uniref:hypothetical protein n=1 Tax=Pseudomonas aeruginosa TaxID=287 RepID=UPI0034E078BE